MSCTAVWLDSGKQLEMTFTCNELHQNDLFLVEFSPENTSKPTVSLKAVAIQQQWTRRWSGLCSAGDINNTIGGFKCFLFYIPVLFSLASCSFLSTNYCVYSDLRHAIQKYCFSWQQLCQNKQMSCQVNI